MIDTSHGIVSESRNRHSAGVAPEMVWFESDAEVLRDGFARDTEYQDTEHMARPRRALAREKAIPAAAQSAVEGIRLAGEARY
jgi:hypothetical protein